MKKKPDLRCRTSCRVTEVLRNSQVKVALGPFGKIPLRNGKFPLPAKRIEPVRLIYAAILTTELMRLLVLCCVVFFFFFSFPIPIVKMANWYKDLSGLLLGAVTVSGQWAYNRGSS
jgi:hypothetical protein